jgi:hypothetical protein
MHTLKPATTYEVNFKGERFYNVVFINGDTFNVVKRSLHEKEAFAWCNYLNGGLGQPYGELPTVETIPVQI